MRNISVAMQEHLSQEVTTLAWCWEVTRQASEIHRFTTFDKNIELNGNTYISRTGFIPSAIQVFNRANPDNISVSGLLSTVLNKADIIAGFYNYIKIKIFLVNWEDLSQGVINLFNGFTGRFDVVDDNTFRVELSSLKQRLLNNIGRVVTPECRVDLGDNSCRVDLLALSREGQITEVTSRNEFEVSLSYSDNDFANLGIFTFTSGRNQGKAIEIRSQIGRDIVLYLATPFNIEVGTTYSMVPGCDKRFSTCHDKFSNRVNFRGFPYLPGLDFAGTVHNPLLRYVQ